jgi:glutathione synthase
MRFVFVMDTLDRVNPELDTSFGFIQAASLLGHQIEHCLIHQVEMVAGVVTAPLREVVYTPGALSLKGDAERKSLADVDAVFVRKDPPFNDAYLYATLLLEHLRGVTLVLNDPRGLREANEKLYALHFAKWMPATIVTSDRARIHEFTREVGGKSVIKPLDGAGGFGVLGLVSDDSNANAIADLLTNEGKQLAIVQAFIPEVMEGDKRVLMLDGELLGAINRVPTGGDHRANIHVGGKTVPAELDKRELEVCAAVGKRLKQDGLYFAGLDLIGGLLTEVNVTSPTGIRELSRFAGTNKSDDVIHWVEKKVQS